MALPHQFSAGKHPSNFVPSGPYYKLTPLLDRPGKHIFSKDIWFPVSGGEGGIAWAFTHDYNKADNFSKKMMDWASSKGGPATQFVTRQVIEAYQKQAGGGLYLSGSALFLDSSPPTFTMQTKLFALGDNKLLNLIEELRVDTHPRLGSSTGNAAVGQGGTVDHPGWWKISVINFSKGEQLVAEMNDMYCNSMQVTMHTPWLEGSAEASVIELRMDFEHAYRGHSGSMKFGK